MTDKELKKLNRNQLLKLLLEVERENEQLRKQNEQLTRKLNEKELRIASAGSIAEASLKLNGIFEAAQKAADQYLYNVQRRASGFEVK